MHKPKYKIGDVVVAMSCQCTIKGAEWTSHWMYHIDTYEYSYYVSEDTIKYKL